MATEPVRVSVLRQIATAGSRVSPRRLGSTKARTVLRRQMRMSNLVW